MVTAARPSIAMLREIKLLRCFTEDELAKLIELGTSVSHPPHANVVIEGELSWGLYLILDGLVGLLKTNKMSGDVYELGHLRAGSFFGEMSLVDDNPRSATVRALSETLLFYISKEAFLGFLDGPGDMKVRFYATCIKDLVARLRDLGDDYVISQYQLWKTVIKKGAA